MKKGLLSPSSITNCQFFPPSSPSNKSLHSTNLDDSFSRLNCSYLKQSQCQNSKFYSFKKIKEDRIKQKNEQGRIIKQMVYKKNQNRRNRLNTLDDVKTIESHNSPRSSISAGKPPRIQQSIILKRGRDLQSQISDQDRKQSFLQKDQQPQTPFFQKRNSLFEQNSKKSDFLKPISVNPAIIKSIQSGLIFHFELSKFGQQMYKQIMSIKHEGILSLYSVISLKSCINNVSLILYEPYTETLIQHLLRAESISYKEVIVYMIELVKILSYLRNQCIYPEIEPTTVLLSHASLKIKLRVNPESSERQAIRQCGYYFSLLFKSLLNGYSPTPSSMTRRISGLTINKRLQFQNLMNEFIRVQDFNLDQAYLKLQTIDC